MKGKYWAIVFLSSVYTSSIWSFHILQQEHWLRYPAIMCYIVGSIILLVLSIRSIVKDWQ